MKIERAREKKTEEPRSLRDMEADFSNRRAVCKDRR